MSTTGANTADMNVDLSSDGCLASEIFSLWLEWKGARSLAESRWTETKKYVFATSTRDTTNEKNPWSNTTHRPKLYHIYNNLLVNTDFSLFPHRDWLEFIGHDEDSVSAEKREAALAYLNTKHSLSGFNKVMRRLIGDWLLYGNCFAGIEYVTETTYDPVMEQDVPSYIGPRPYRISPYDIVFNPKASSFKDSPKIIRSFTSVGELQRMLDTNPGIGYEADVLAAMKEDRIMAQNRSETDGEKAESFVSDGFGDASEYYTSGHAIIYEFYGDIYDRTTDTFLKNHLITVADGKYILRKVPLNTYSGKPNIFHAGWKERPDNLWAFGPLDNLVGMQYRINHLENAKADAFDDMLDPDIVIQGDVEIERNGASTNYYITEGGGVHYLHPDTTVLNADFQIQNIEDAMELYAGAPREAVGIRSPGEKTAFEVNQLMNAANRVFEYQTGLFSDFLEDVVNAELEEAKRNLDTSDVISVIDNDFGVTEFIRITREDLMSNGRVIPVGAREYSRKARLTQQLMTFYSTGMQDPEVSQHFPSNKIAKLWAELLDFEELYTPYGRIPERMEAQKLANVAEDLAMEHSMIDETNADAIGEELSAEQLPEEELE